MTWKRREAGTLHAEERHMQKLGSLRKRGEHKDGGRAEWLEGRVEGGRLVGPGKGSVPICLLCRKLWKAH